MSSSLSMTAVKNRSLSSAMDWKSSRMSPRWSPTRLQPTYLPVALELSQANAQIWIHQRGSAGPVSMGAAGSFTHSNSEPS